MLYFNFVLNQIATLRTLKLESFAGFAPALPSQFIFVLQSNTRVFIPSVQITRSENIPNMYNNSNATLLAFCCKSFFEYACRHHLETSSSRWRICFRALVQPNPPNKSTPSSTSNYTSAQSSRRQNNSPSAQVPRAGVQGPNRKLGR